MTASKPTITQNPISTIGLGLLFASFYLFSVGLTLAFRQQNLTDLRK